MRTHILPEIPLIHVSKQNDIVDQLLHIIDIHESNEKIYREEIERLKQEVAELKNSPKKPQIKPSSIENKKIRNKSKKRREKKAGKKQRLPIHEEQIIALENPPEGSCFKGHRKFFVQDIEFRIFNTLFKLERWMSQDGKYHQAKLPPGYENHHFGPHLRVFIKYQYYQQKVTRPRLLRMLRDLGLEISEGELNILLLEETGRLQEESKEVLKEGLIHSAYAQTDDTGARSEGRNKVCTQIGNEFFTFLQTSESKSRIEFLKLLNIQGEYSLNKYSLDYLRQHASLKLVSQMESHLQKFSDEGALKAFFNEQKLREGQKRIVEEAALIGSITELLGKDFVIVSDGAARFHILKHGACWVHALRLLEKEIPLRKEARDKVDKILQKLRFLYHHLKRYKTKPSEVLKNRLEDYFDLVCDLRTPSKVFNEALERFSQNKDDLLRVLEAPSIPLHNNQSEQDLRDYVIRRKISYGTRSKLGMVARDTYCSILSTCQKLGISIWKFLTDRITGSRLIQPLAFILKERLQVSL